MHQSTHQGPNEGSRDDGGAVVAAVAACGLLGVVFVMAMVVGELTLLVQQQPAPW